MLLPLDVSQISLHKKERHRSPYPPLGFLAFFESELGNGDSFGLYWPIGREFAEPLVAETWHDESRIQPNYSSLSCFLSARSVAEDEYPEPPTIIDDPFSPRACFDAARELIKTQETDAAISFLERAISTLPEYTDALALLWGQYVRKGHPEEATQIAVQALISPPSFGARPLRALRWLCSASSPSLENDPIWQARTKLKLTFGGAKENGDYLILRDAIDKYLAESDFLRASTLMQTYAELMLSETTAFQARYGFDREQFVNWQSEVSANLPGGPRNVEF